MVRTHPESFNPHHPTQFQPPRLEKLTTQGGDEEEDAEPERTTEELLDLIEKQTKEREDRREKRAREKVKRKKIELV